MTNVCFIKIRSKLSSVLLLCLLTTNFYETDVIYLHFQFEFTIIRTKLEKKYSMDGRYCNKKSW